MQNKRGISQAFARPIAQLQIRPATIFDVFDMSRVLIASIRNLCAAEHRGDAGRIAGWTAGMTPERIRAWIDGPGRYWLAERGGEAVAVGGLDQDGAISLLHTAPAAAGQGAGSALLAHLEAELRSRGSGEGRLNATRTALGFCRKRGWQEAGTARGCGGMPRIAMRKPLL